MRARRKPLIELLHVLVDQAVISQLVPELGKLLAVRQIAVDQQVGDLRELGMLGQLLDRIPAVAEDALLAVDIGDGARAGARVAVAQIEGDGAGLRAEGRNVDPVLAFGADNYGQSDLTPIET